MTLSQAIDDFNLMPTAEACEALIKTGLDYWKDAMISDETFANDVLKEVAEWLIKP